MPGDVLPGSRVILPRTPRRGALPHGPPLFRWFAAGGERLGLAEFHLAGVVWCAGFPVRNPLRSFLPRFRVICSWPIPGFCAAIGRSCSHAWRHAPRLPRHAAPGPSPGPHARGASPPDPHPFRWCRGRG
jgi:hypothetical protein